jgi:hypothetical protein
MDTLDRSPARTTPSKRVENVGYTLVAVGYAVMTLCILEVGGLYQRRGRARRCMDGLRVDVRRGRKAGVR